MPRYRKLHVKTVESHDVNDMPDDFTRLLWILLPLGLCQEGRGVDNVGWIKGKAFPMRFDVTPEMIDQAMCWFAERGMIQRYQVEGRAYFCIPNETWHKYQGSTEREADTEYPPPPDWIREESQPSPDLVVNGSRSSTHTDSSTPSSANADSSSSVAAAPQPVDNSQPVPLVDDDDALLQELLDAGMTKKKAKTVVQTCTPERIRGWVVHVRNNGNIKNPGGYLWTVLGEGDEEAPRVHASPDDHTSKDARRRYASDLTMPIEAEPP